MKQAFSEGLLCKELNEASTVAVVTLWSGGMTWASCIESLLLHTSSEVPICVWDDAGPSSNAVRELQKLEKELSREVFYHRQLKNLGVVGNLNHAFESFENSDVIVLNSDIVVGPNWDKNLRQAASSRTDVATVTSLCNGEGLFGIGEIPQLGKRIPTVLEFASLSEKVRENSSRILPVVPTATSFCTLFTRRALNVVGFLDQEFSPGYGEEVDFSLRCTAFGFVHLAEDSVLVFHATGESFGVTSLNQRKEFNDELVARRYGFWQALIDDFISDKDSTLARSINIAKSSVAGLKIVIDAEKVNPDLTGTFEGASRLINALWQHPQVHSVTLISPIDGLQRLREWSSEHSNGAVEILAIDSIVEGKMFDIAFRPYQDYSSETWPRVKRLGIRNVVWHLDLIATHNPTYSSNFESFYQLNSSVKNSLDQADAIGVLTEHVMNDLRSSYGGKGLAEKLYILQNGPTHSSSGETVGKVSAELQKLDVEPYLLVLGTNYRHKNLTWLMRVFLLVREMGWIGKMVVVGPTPTLGGSLEQDKLLAESTIPDAFAFIGRVDEADKLNLLRGAKLVIVPSITEGWGLVPFEAALEGVPVVTSDGGGLRDVMPKGVLKLNLGSDYESAITIYRLLTETSLSQMQLELWHNAASELSWTDSAESLVVAGFKSLSHASWLNSEDESRVGEVDVNFDLIRPRPASRFSNLVFRTSRVLFPLGSRRRNKLKMLFPNFRHPGTIS